MKKLSFFTLVLIIMLLTLFACLGKSNSSSTATSQSSTRLSGMYSTYYSALSLLLYYTFDTNGTYVFGNGDNGAVSYGTYTVEESNITLNTGKTFTIVNSTTIKDDDLGRLYTK